MPSFAIEAFDELIDLGGMPFRLHIVEGVTNYAFLVDDECRTYYTELLVAVPLAELGHAELATDFAFLVGQEAYRQAMLVAEIRVREAIVTRDAEDDAVEPGKFAFMVRKIGGLQRAIGRAVTRIEKQHRILPAAQGREIEPFHISVRQ